MRTMLEPITSRVDVGALVGRARRTKSMVRLLVLAMLFWMTAPICHNAMLHGNRVWAANTLSPEDAAHRLNLLLKKELGVSAEQSPRVSDEVFLRRVTLDLLGRNPTTEEIVLFSLDTSADKRTSMVRRLLADTDYGRNWARYWRDVIFYRKTEERSGIAMGACESYLMDEFNKNTPWDRIASAFITASGDVQEQGSTALIMAQAGKPEETVAEVSRIFMGIQIQCAQCHDHPTDRWKREQFHELAAFFPRVAIRRDASTRPPKFSVVVNDRESNAGRRANANQRVVGTPEHRMPDKDDPTAAGTTMQPVFFVNGKSMPTGTKDADRRGALAQWVTSGDNPWFAKAMVNRMWSEFVGEGFYEPIDDLGPDRTCTAEQSLDFLALEFFRSGYDVKWLLNTIVLTDSYQRISRARRSEGEVAFQANVPQRLRGDQVFQMLADLFSIPEAGMAAGPNRPGAPIRSPRGQFNAVFGFDPSAPREEIAGSVPQALVMMNHPLVRAGIDGNRGKLASMLQKIKDDEELIVELYMQTLARQPTEKEIATCRDYVREVDRRQEAYEDIFWSLVNSTEFLHRR